MPETSAKAKKKPRRKAPPRRQSKGSSVGDLVDALRSEDAPPEAAEAPPEAADAPPEAVEAPPEAAEAPPEAAEAELGSPVAEVEEVRDLDAASASEAAPASDEAAAEPEDAADPEPAAEAAEAPSERDTSEDEAASAGDEGGPDPSADEARPAEADLGGPLEFQRGPLPEGVVLEDAIPIDPDDDLSQVEGDASPRMVSIVESLLFAASKPMTVKDLHRLLKEATLRQVQLALKRLLEDTRDRGVVLSQVAGGFRLRTHPDNARWVQQLMAGKPVRLSRSQLEALAVVAYRQPITKAEVDHVRGVDTGAVLKVLLERDLIKYVGRKEEVGRPHLYGTTLKFLEFFNLRSLRDMPALHEFRELTDDSQALLRESLGDDEDEDALEREAMGQEIFDFGGEAEGAAPGEVEADEVDREVPTDEAGPDPVEAAMDEVDPDLLASAVDEADPEEPALEAGVPADDDFEDGGRALGELGDEPEPDERGGPEEDDD